MSPCMWVGIIGLAAAVGFLVWGYWNEFKR